MNFIQQVQDHSSKPITCLQPLELRQIAPGTPPDALI
jgi:hypothetical protein